MAKKKTAEDLYSLAVDLVGEYAQRDADLDRLEQYYFQTGDHDPYQEQEEGHTEVRLPYGTNIIDLVQDLLGGANLTIAVPALSSGKADKDLADAAEEFLKAAMHQSERAQRQDFMSRAAWIVGMRGALAGRVLAMPEWMEKEGDSYKQTAKLPLLLQVRDPRHIYPNFGLDGLSYVVEQRTRKVDDLRSVYGDDLLPNAKPGDEVEWTEYWDSTTYCYWANGEPVKKGAGRKRKAGPWPHLYGGCPYVYEFARQTGKLEPEDRARPILKAAAPIIDRLEKADSAEATFLDTYNGDTLNVYTEDEDFKVSTKPGDVNYMGAEERMEWLRASRRPLETTQAETKLNAQLGKATFPESMYGTDPGRVMAGYALNLLNQSGQARIKPIIDCLERSLETLFENTLMVAENYLQELLDGPISFYRIDETEDEEGNRYRARNKRKLDAKKFDGFYLVNVSLADLMPADQQANVVLANRVREQGPDGRPLLSWETAVETFKLVENPGEERDRIDREAAWNDPVITELRRQVLVSEIMASQMKELAELGLDPMEVLAAVQEKLNPQPQQPQPEMPAEGPPPGMPPGMAPPQETGQLMPQPMGAMGPNLTPLEEPVGEQLMPPGPGIPGGF